MRVQSRLIAFRLQLYDCFGEVNRADQSSTSVFANDQVDQMENGVVADELRLVLVEQLLKR